MVGSEGVQHYGSDDGFVDGYPAAEQDFGFLARMRASDEAWRAAMEARLRASNEAWEASLEESTEEEPQDFDESGDHSLPHLGMGSRD